MAQGAASAEPLARIIDAALGRHDGWLPFDRFMALALYAPGVGYYASGGRKFGHMPQSGSDFVTAPEMSPLFGNALARQIAEAFDRTGCDEVWEFGAGSGALAAQLIEQLGDRLSRYHVIELSASLRERQQGRLALHGERVVWHDELPDAMRGVAIGNEVLDAMPVQLLARKGGVWRERGVVRRKDRLAFEDRPTLLRPPIDVDGAHDYLTEIHPQARAFIATLADRLVQGAAFFVDYGFPEAEYYHPQRHMGTLMCHLGHRADVDPLVEVGRKDITSHVDFTGIALAGQEAGLQVLGYTSQARFLFNLGLTDDLATVGLAGRTMAARLVHEHEMGELFKVIGFAVGEEWPARGFAQGDRSHTL